MVDFDKYKKEYDCPTCKVGKLVLRQVSNQTKALYSCNLFKRDGNGGIHKCEQTIWLNQFNINISPEQIDKLINEGSTDYIKFKSVKGNEFEAKIIFFENNTKIVFEEDHEEETKIEGVQCPACDSNIYQRGGYYCEGYMDKTCGVYIPKSIASYPISLEIAKTLLEGKITKIIDGFKNKKGDKFSSRLILNEDTLRVSFDSTIRDCPNNNCSGSIVNFPKVYKCNNNTDDDEDGCDFLIFKNIAGAEINKTLLNQLIDNGRSKDTIKMVSKKGSPFFAYLVYKDGKIIFEFEKTN